MNLETEHFSMLTFDTRYLFHRLIKTTKQINEKPKTHIDFVFEILLSNE